MFMRRNEAQTWLNLDRDIHVKGFDDVKVCSECVLARFFFAWKCETSRFEPSKDCKEKSKLDKILRVDS